MTPISGDLPIPPFITLPKVISPFAGEIQPNIITRTNVRTSPDMSDA